MEEEADGSVAATGRVLYYIPAAMLFLAKSVDDACEKSTMFQVL